MSKIANPGLSEEGEKNFLWAREHMKTLVRIADKYAGEKPLKGVRIGVCLHITKETAVLIDSLIKVGAEVKVAAANPLSTQDDIAAYLATKVDIWAWRGENKEEYDWCIRKVIESEPEQIIDDGADMHVHAHLSKVKGIVGGSEETTTGVIRLRALEGEGKLLYPIIAVNNARTKFLFDNRYGTGQSTIDGILRATSLLLAGKKVVVVGYGWVGRGIANRARGMGANVTVVEVEPIRALEAYLDGFDVRNIDDAAEFGDIFITATGQVNAIPYSAIQRMKDGAILANAGHFDVEIDVKSLLSKAVSVREVRPNVDEIVLPNKKKVYIIGKGRVVNLVAAEGHPPEVMQMSFANQLLAQIYIRKNYHKMEKKLYDVPEQIEKEVAYSTLDSLGIRIGELTKEQIEYARSWAL